MAEKLMVEHIEMIPGARTTASSSCVHGDTHMTTALTLQSFLGRFGGGFAYMDRGDLFWIACVVMVCFYASIYARHLDALD